MSRGDSVQIDESEQRATIRWGWGTLIYRAALFLGVPLLIAGGIQFADGHNDARYVAKMDYRRDRESDTRERAAEREAMASIAKVKEAALERELSAQRLLLEEMKGDIKHLLRKP